MRRQPRLCPQSSPEEEEGVPALPVLVSSLTPSFPKRPKRQPTYQCHTVPRAGELTASLPSIQLLRTSGLLSPWRPASSSISQESQPASSPGLWGRQKAVCSRKEPQL